MLKVAIASGKGGTGKTTLATNLALAAEREVLLLDCDVEEPNCHLFLKPEIESREPVEVMIPEVDAGRCLHCGKCGEICQYSAIVSLKTAPLVFPELCHSCRGCLLVCPEHAISEGKRTIGEIERGRAGGVNYAGGWLRIGESMAPPLIREVKKSVPSADLTIIDAPPGTSCPVIEATRGSDYLVLVTEPTPFGLNDLKLAVSMAHEIGLEFGVVINRADIGNGITRDYCSNSGIRVLLEIPDDRRVAEAYSRGVPMIQAIPESREVFQRLLREIGR
jgi:MinD superfamily P-loop ATPase